MGEVFKEFFVRVSEFLALVRRDILEIRFHCRWVSGSFCFIKKSHLSLDTERGCLLCRTAIKIAGQENNIFWKKIFFFQFCNSFF